MFYDFTFLFNCGFYHVNAMVVNFIINIQDINKYLVSEIRVPISLGIGPTMKCLRSFPFLWLFPSCRVAGMTDGLSSPHRPVRLLARSQSRTFQIPLTYVSFHLVFGRPLFLFPGISALNTFLSMCSPSLLITCPYQINLLSVIFLEACLL